MCLCSALRTESLNFEYHFQPMNYCLSASYTVEPLFQFHVQLQSSLPFAGKYSANFLFSSKENHLWNNFYIQNCGQKREQRWKIQRKTHKHSKKFIYN